MVYPRYRSCSATESEFKPGQALFKQVLSSTHSAHLISPAGQGFVGQPQQEIADSMPRTKAGCSEPASFINRDANDLTGVWGLPFISTRLSCDSLV